MNICGTCWKKAYRTESLYCIHCGARLLGVVINERRTNGAYPVDRSNAKVPADSSDYNVCTNPDCEQNVLGYTYPDEAISCDICGCRTTYRYKRKKT